LGLLCGERRGPETRIETDQGQSFLDQAVGVCIAKGLLVTPAVTLEAFEGMDNPI
jgi:hypothetical protein